MNWIITENDKVACEGLSIKDLPDSLPPKIKISWSDANLNLESDNLTGVIACKNGNKIIIEPKYRMIHPLEMVSYIQNENGIITPDYYLAQGNNKLEIQSIARIFVEQLQLLQSKTIKFKRRNRTVETDSVKGKIDLYNTYKNFNSGKFDKIVSATQIPVLNISENALLAAAAQKIQVFYSSESIEKKILYPWVKLAKEFNNSPKTLTLMGNKLNAQRLSGSRSYYSYPVSLAKMILQIDSSEIKQLNQNSMLYHMPSLYESYIRTGFERVGKKLGLTISKGFIPRCFMLSTGEGELIPDIVVYKGKDIKAIIDAKYKIPDSKDLYQVFTYLKFAGVEQAFIISPDVENSMALTFDGSIIKYIKIDNSNFLELENTVQSILENLK